MFRVGDDGIAKVLDDATSEDRLRSAVLIDPPAQHHLGFGTGQHHQCLGMHLVRLEPQVGIDAVLGRLPNLRLDQSRSTPRIQGLSFRGPNAVHVTFNPS